MLEWLRRRRDERGRRRQEREARDAEAQRRAFEIMRTVAEPLVADGVATLEWLEPDPQTGVGPGVRLVPTRAEAVTVELFAGWHYLNVHFVRDVPGSYWGVTEDLQPDPDGPHPDWEDQLRQMLLAVAHGGLSELVEAERHGYLRTLTFTQPDGEELIRRASYSGTSRRSGERSFPGYR